MADNTTNTTDTQNNKNTQTKAKHYRYPIRQIKSNTDYLEIKVVKYKPPGLETSSGTLGTITQGTKSVLDALKEDPKKQLLGSICLPVPQNISDNNSVTWGEDTLNPLQAFGLGTFNQLVNGKILDQQGLAEYFSREVSKVNEAFGNSKVRSAVVSAIGGKVFNTLGGNVSYNSLIARATGQVFNSNLELLFSGPNIRTFPFIFDLVPRDRREASEVKDIIRMFKKHMSTKRGDTQGIFLESPDVFIIKYKTGNKDHPFLNKFKPCALVDMNINYTGSGTYATYQDSTPVHLQMTLTFKELNPIYAEDYDSETGKGGVGY